MVKLDDEGNPVCSNCGENGECSRFMDHYVEELGDNEKCHICLMDETPCEYCASMM